MKEHPILFSAPMVRAILAGTKTQTRMVLKLQPPADAEHHSLADVGHPWHDIYGHNGPAIHRVRCPYGQPKDRLWVRENFCPIYPEDPHYNGGRPIEYDYQATYKHGHRLGDLIGEKKKWKPSIHMPRTASRITLEITGVRVERLHDISESDAIAEGVRVHADHHEKPCSSIYSPVQAYRDLWESINGAGSWDANPWVWVVEFKRVEGGAA